MPDVHLTALGQLLEQAREHVHHISVREAARRAHVSDTRWRQVVTGVQTKASGRVPVNPTARTVVAMALAVGVDAGDALRAAGLEATDEAIAAMTAEARGPQADKGAAPAGLVEEIERIKSLPIAPADRIRIANALIELYQEQAKQESESEQRLLA